MCTSTAGPIALKSHIQLLGSIVTVINMFALENIIWTRPATDEEKKDFLASFFFKFALDRSLLLFLLFFFLPCRTQQCSA